MPRHKPMSDAAKLAHIAEWFSRHRADYCHHCQAPPQVWTVHFQWLLDRVSRDEQAERRRD